MRPLRDGLCAPLGLAAIVACGLGLAGVSPVAAGTTLRGRVVVPAAVLAKKGLDTRDAVNAGDVVVYVSQKPGAEKPKKMTGKPAHQDVMLDVNRIQPRVVTLPLDSRVRFKNRGRVYHSLFGVTATGRMEIGSLGPGETRELTLDHPGVINVFCQLHPAAAAFVLVCPTKYHTQPDAAGQYALGKLPRGSYVVHAWHPLLGEIRRPVEVTGKGDLPLDLRF